MEGYASNYEDDKFIKAALEIRVRMLDLLMKDVIIVQETTVRRGFLIIQNILRLVRREELALDEITEASRAEVVSDLLSKDQLSSIEDHAKTLKFKDLARSIRHFDELDTVQPKESVPR